VSEICLAFALLTAESGVGADLGSFACMSAARRVRRAEGGGVQRCLRQRKIQILLKANRQSFLTVLCEHIFIMSAAPALDFSAMGVGLKPWVIFALLKPTPLMKHLKKDTVVIGTKRIVQNL